MAGLNGAEERVDDGPMNLDFSRICRLCLNFSREFVDLRPSNGNRNGARHIIDQIKYCYSIKIDLTEPLPSKVCFQCIQILTLFSATKRNIKYSEMMLRNILNIRNANHILNSQSSRQGINLSILQRYLQPCEDRQSEQGSSVAQDRPTEDNHLQNLRISPIQISTVRELYRRQNQAIQDDNNQNVPTNPNQNQSTDKKPTEKGNVESRKSNTEKRNTENRKSNIDNSKTNTDDRKSNIDNPKTNTDDRKSNIDNRKSNADNPKTNTDNRKSNIDNRKSNADNPKTNTDNRKSNTDNSKTNTDNRKSNAENAKVVENKPIETKQNDSSDTNSNTVESSSKSRPSCSTNTNSTPQEENVGKTTKQPEEDKMESTNKKPNSANNINRKRSFVIDRKRDLRVKLEILDLKNAKKFCSPSTGSLSVSTEGLGGGTSGETTSGKVVKEIGTVIDESNILSPKVKRMRKSIPKG